MSLVLNSNGSELYTHEGAVYGVNPAETMFGATYWAHFIPPERPEHTLMLGYGWGTSAELIRKIWGQCKITAVDISGYQKVDAYMEYKMEVMDAKDYVWDATETVLKKRFDYIAIDLWEGLKVPEFVYEAEFAIRIKEMAKKYVCINIPSADVKRLKGFHDYGFKFMRVVPIEGNSVLWWTV